MGRAMDKYYMIGTFALLATAVIALPTIFTSSPTESSSPLVSSTTEAIENGTFVTNATTEHPEATVEPLPSHKFKRGLFDGLFGYHTESTTHHTTESVQNVTGGLDNFTDVTTTAGHIVEPVSFQPPLPKFNKRSIIDIAALYVSTASSSVVVGELNATTAFPLLNATEIASHHNATPFKLSFPFFQNDESDHTSAESSEESSSHAGAHSDHDDSTVSSDVSSTTCNDSSSTPASSSTLLPFQNDEIVKPAVSIAPVEFNATAFNSSADVTHSHTVPPAQSIDLSVSGSNATVHPIGSFTYKYPFFT